MFENYVPSVRFYVFDKQDVWLGHFERITSVQWLERWTAAGECKITLDLTEFNMNLYSQAFSVVCSDSKQRMVLCHNDSEQEAGTISGTMIIRGFSWLGWLDRRVIRGTHMISNIEKGMYDMTAPAYDVMWNAGPDGYPATTSKQISWGTVMEAEQGLCELSGYGMLCEHDFDPTGYSPGLIRDRFIVRQSTDRTDLMGGNYIGVFSDLDGTLTEVQLNNGWEEYRNRAIVCGEDSGSDRKNIEVYIGSTAPAGRDRLEMYVDARDLQSEYTENGVEKVLTPAEYNELMRQRGLEKLQENIRTLNISAVPNTQARIFNEDYFLGDIIPVKLRALEGADATARVEESTLIYEAEETSVRLTLSNFQIVTIT